MKGISKYFPIILTIILTGCLESYNPEISGESSQFLVIDGVITDEPGPYTVKVTNSFPLDVVGAEDDMVQGLNITIEEENGVIERLIETSEGVYQSTFLVGEVGNRYRLKFDYDGEQYQSSWVKINSSALIDSVYYHVESKKTTEIDTEIEGVQFYIDSYGSQQDAVYYRYEWEETWEIGVFYPSFFDYLGNDKLELTTDPRHTCWKYRDQASINVATSYELSENVISRHSLAFVTGEEEKFAKKYSLLVKQYALDENEYKYWRSIQETNEQLGSLYDKQPENLRGNILNLTSPKEIVLGYFSASGLKKKRLFINDLQYLSEKVECSIPLDTLMKSDLGFGYEERVLSQIESGKFFIDFVSTMTTIEPLGVFLSSSKCSDCQSKGGDVNKPIYWDE